MPSEIKVSKIDRKHDYYTTNSEMWYKTDVLYQGGVKLINEVQRFITRRPKEMQEVFYERARRLTYQNILQQCVSWHLSKLFREDPMISMGTDDRRMQAFRSNSNRAGASFIEQSRDLLSKLYLYGRCYVLSDMPQQDGTSRIVTRQDEIDSGSDVPYINLYDPSSVINWKTDRFGNLDWCVIRLAELDQETPFSEVKRKVCWWVFDRQNYYKYESKVSSDGIMSVPGTGSPIPIPDMDMARLVDSGKHPMAEYNQVPIKCYTCPEDLWFANRAYLHLLEHVDESNAYSWKMLMANLPQLVVKSDKEVDSLSLAESGYINIGGSDDILWLEPNGSSFKESRAHITDTKVEIFRAFSLQAVASQSNPANDESGFSKQMDMEPAIDTLNAVGTVMRPLMACMIDHAKVACGLGKTKPANVSGFVFETKPMIQQITQYQTASVAGILPKSPTLEKTLAGDIAMGLVDSKPQETKDKIIAEIQAAPTTPIGFVPATQVPLEKVQDPGNLTRKQQAGNIDPVEKGVVK